MGLFNKMPIIELSEKEIQDLLNGEELDKTFFAYDGNLTIRRLPVMEDKEIENAK